MINEMIESSNGLNPSYNEESSYEIPNHIGKIITNFDEWLFGPQGGGNKGVASYNESMIKRLRWIIGVTSLDDLLDDNILWRIFLAKKRSNEINGVDKRPEVTWLL